jgi:hypothetical protein
MKHCFQQDHTSKLVTLKVKVWELFGKEVTKRWHVMICNPVIESCVYKAGDYIHLWGFLYDIEKEHLQLLVDYKHPSLWNKSILFGPLSLVNHECCSKLNIHSCFNNSTLNYKPEVVKHIKSVAIKVIQGQFELKKDQELVVCYSATSPSQFQCNCNFHKNRLLSTNDQEDIESDLTEAEETSDES